MKFALLGCGRIAEKHVHALAHLPGASVVGVCDLDVVRARSFAARAGGEAFTDIDDMLRRARPDIVSVLTPSGLHAEHARQVLAAGVSVIIEKPMALRFEDGEALVRLADANRARIFVVKQNRFHPTVLRLRREFEAGRFGRIVLGTVRVRWTRNQAYYDAEPWRGTWAWDGGVLANQASHHVDLLQWMMGDVESVFARTATRLVDIETDDTAVAVLKFTSGALGIIEATTATRPKDLEGSLSLLGERGSVVLGGFIADKVETWKFDGDAEGDEAAIKAELATPLADFVSPHYQFLRDVQDIIAHNRRALIDGIEGLKNLQLLHALYESAETGAEVSLIFRPRRSRLGS